MKAPDIPEFLDATASSRSLVYIARNNCSGKIKIGWTIDLRKRLSALKSSSGADFHLIRTIDGGRRIEKWLHKKFAPQRIEGEWFRYHPDMQSIIPPDEIIRPKQYVFRRDIGLTVLERLRDAELTGRQSGLPDRLILSIFVSHLTDQEARALLNLTARGSEAA